MSAPYSHTDAEPPYLTPLHSAIEQQIGELGRSGAIAWTVVLPLLNRCSQIIKGFEERIATGELCVVSERATPPTSAECVELALNAAELTLLDNALTEYCDIPCDSPEAPTCRCASLIHRIAIAMTPKRNADE